jgi:opacity protein-like surface antigen
VTLVPFRNPCNSDILTLTGMTTSGNAASGTYQQITTDLTILGERSYYNTVKLGWQPNRHFSGYVGYRFGRRTLRLGDGISGIIFESTDTFTNNGTGTPPATPTTSSSATGELETEGIDYHTVLAGVVVRPITEWRINADLELLSANNFFINIAPRHQQRVRIYTTYKPKSWLSLNGGVHLVETRNGYAPAQTLDDSTTPLFPSGGAITPYGHTDHWRYYTLGIGVNPNSRIFFDLGWTYLNQDIKSATCMPLPANAFTGLTAPTACANGATARALLLDYRETTHSGYTMLSVKPVKRVTLNLGYEITTDNGRTDWLRLDTGDPLMVVGDVYGIVPALPGNAITPCPGLSVAAGCVFPGPFPDQPLGPQAINWHKVNAGVSVEVYRGVELKGLWSYYDYNGKDEVPGLALLQVTAPRDFHANVGTFSLKYSF